MKARIFTVLVSAATLLPALTFANQVRFPDEELARESVLPVFDEAPVVMDRRVKTAGRFEVGPRFSISLLEVFNSEYGAGVDLTYNITETHGLNFVYNSFFGGKTRYAQAMERDMTLPGGAGKVDLTNAPATEYLATLNYQYTSHYGKISLTKFWVMNLALYGSVGAGVISVGEEATPTAQLGIGQKFYFNNNFAFRFGLQSLIYSGPNIVSSGAVLTKIKNASQPLKASEFEKEMKFPIQLVSGLVMIF